MKKRSIKVLKTLDEKNLASIARIFLSSLILIFAFYSLPLMINFANDKILNTQEFKNKSKVILAYTLDRENNESVDESFDESDLLVDIYSLNNKETDFVNNIINRFLKIFIRSIF